MSFALDLLNCLSCGEPLGRGPAVGECSSCGCSATLNQFGVIHFRAGRGPELKDHWVRSEDARYASEYNMNGHSPREMMKKLEVSLTELRRLQPDDFWHSLAEFSATRYGYAVLGATYEGTTSLVLRSGWGELVRVIAQLGGRALGIDTASAGLRYSGHVGAGDARQAFVHSKVLLPLPFCDGSFDNVFWDTLPGLKERESAEVETNSIEPHALLQECVRVLKPNGRLLLTVRNRASLWRTRSRSSNLLAELMRAPADEGPESAGVSKARRPTRGFLTRLGVLYLLRRLDLRDVEVNTLWPDPVGWTSLLPAREPIRADAFNLPEHSVKDRLRNAVFHGLTRVGAGRLFVPGYCIVAKKPPYSSTAAEPPASSSAWERIIRETSQDIDRIRRISSHSNSQSLSFRSGGRFVKIPLTSTSAELLLAASTNLKDASDLIKGTDGFIPRVEWRNTAGTAYTVYPYIDHTESKERADRIARLEYALQRLAADTRMLPLDTTDCWKRLFEEKGRADLTALGAADLLTHLERDAARKVVPCGLVHGDLAPGNLIQSGSDSYVLIDWDRCEGLSPKFLDAVHACHSVTRVQDSPRMANRRGPKGALIQWIMLFEQDGAIPLLDRVHAARGELGWREMIGIALLGQVERRLHATRSSPVSRLTVEPVLRARLSLVQDYLLGAEAPVTRAGE